MTKSVEWRRTSLKSGEAYRSSAEANRPRLEIPQSLQSKHKEAR